MTTLVEYGWVYNVLDSVSRCEFWLIADEMRNSDHPLTKLLLEMYSVGVTDDTTRAREFIFELGEQCAESADLVQVEGWGGRILSATAAGMCCRWRCRPTTCVPSPPIAISCGAGFCS